MLWNAKEIDMDIEHQILDLSHTLEVSRRIVEQPFRPDVDGDKIIHHLVVDELVREIPRLEAKLSWLASELGDRRDADEKDLEPAQVLRPSDREDW